ncbi:MAG: hypothetical protein WCJ37_17910, partial [Syntrophus sp. (in: bacteria)]
ISSMIACRSNFTINLLLLYVACDWDKAGKANEGDPPGCVLRKLLGGASERSVVPRCALRKLPTEGPEVSAIPLPPQLAREGIRSRVSRRRIKVFVTGDNEWCTIKYPLPLVHNFVDSECKKECEREGWV